MIDHVGFEVSDLARSASFYDAVFFALPVRNDFREALFFFLPVPVDFLRMAMEPPGRIIRRS